MPQHLRKSSLNVTVHEIVQQKIQKEKEKLEENLFPVRAVMVMNAAGNIYWGEVNENTEKIEELNTCCNDEALPRFLTVLNLIFEEINQM